MVLSRALKWFAAGSGVVVPASAYFAGNAPPLFPEIGIITAAMCSAIIYSVQTYRLPLDKTRRGLPKLVRNGVTVLMLSLVILVAYVLLLRWTTVLDPQSANRFQIGFGTARWSLTTLGDRCIFRSRSIEECMLSQTAFTNEGPFIIWKPWTVYAAGTSLIVMHLIAFTFWTLAFSLLAKHKSENDPLEATGVQAIVTSRPSNEQNPEK